jgi:hypothetical protein
MGHETEQPQVIPLRKPTEAQPTVTSGRDHVGHPFVTWRVPNGPCWRAWIEPTHGQAGARFLFSEQTDTIDGNAIGEPISAPVCHDMADMETLLVYVWATLDRGR